MADGSSSKAIGDFNSVLIQVQGVLIRVLVHVFQQPPYHLLLGTDSIKSLGISADYGRSHFCISSDYGIKPLLVEFNTFTYRLNKIQSEDFSEESKYDSGEETSTEDTSSEGSTSGYDSYLILPCFEDETPTSESFYNENLTNVSQDIHENSKEIKTEPTSDEDKLEAKVRLDYNSQFLEKRTMS